MCAVFSPVLILVVHYFQFVFPSDVGRLKNAAALEKLMYEEKIIPDLIDEAPQYAVTVQYSGRSFSFGNKVQVFDIVNRPKVVNWPLTKGEKYTLIMTGLDVPSLEDHKYREYLHWLVVNIPDRDLRKGEHVPEYNGAIRHYQEGIHRVVYLVYRQNETLNVKGDHHHRDCTKVNRKNFSTRAFAREYKLGVPFAINWAEVDESCDIMTPPDLELHYKDEEDGI